MTDNRTIDYQIYNSYKYNNEVFMKSVLRELKDYNDIRLCRSNYNRTICGMYYEWKEHNAIYNAIKNHEGNFTNDMKESAKHVDLDQYAEGTLLNPIYK